jgi:hypothetical protein
MSADISVVGGVRVPLGVGAVDSRFRISSQKLTDQP